MFIWLSDYLVYLHSGFGVVKYLTLRVILSALTALIMSLLIGPFFIRSLKSKQIGQNVRGDGPKSHISKTGTPTMGGMLIVLCILISTLCWSMLDNRFVWIALSTMLLFAMIGWFDDHLKVVRKNPHGLRAAQKYFIQSVAAIIIASVLFYNTQSIVETQLIVPFIKSLVFDLGWFYIILTYFVIVGSSNAVNLTDGLDGLAIMPTVLIAAALAIFAYVAGHSYFANYLDVPYVYGSGEVAVFCGSIVGAGLGFLWFNTYPAQVFMGDIGALALGAALGVVAVVVRQELVFFIMAGIFVVETLSVIVQVGSYKLCGKRVFRMAPLHHHYELKGWPEPRVIVRFWIITVILVLIGLSSLKIR